MLLFEEGTPDLEIIFCPAVRRTCGLFRGAFSLRAAFKEPVLQLELRFLSMSS